MSRTLLRGSGRSLVYRGDVHCRAAFVPRAQHEKREKREQESFRFPLHLYRKISKRNGRKDRAQEIAKEHGRRGHIPAMSDAFAGRDMTRTEKKKCSSFSR